VSYATEVVKLEKLERSVEEILAQDDSVDEFKPPIARKPTISNLNGVNGLSSGHPSGSPPMAIPAELNNRLASIDANLTRIADALELLVAAMGPRSR
jgi:hypothetical protein